ncbi:MAG TPA: hypothetical protein VF297_13835 [Pyrinomonadaceae bacterium]
MFKSFTSSRLASAAVAVVALLLSLAQSAAAQNATTATQPASQTPQTQVASETVVAKAAGPLYREYRGVTLGMSAADVRAKLGKPQEKSDVMDFYVFNDRERARVYYTDGKASAIIATYIGKDGGAPPPAAVLGTEIETKPDGSMYMMTPYKQAGYWVAYSRTAGDAPMVMITMQKTP